MALKTAPLCSRQSLAARMMIPPSRLHAAIRVVPSHAPPAINIGHLLHGPSNILRSRSSSILAKAAVPSSRGMGSDRAEMVSMELKTLELERDEALSVAESCAKTCVKLMEMIKLLDDLSLEKVAAGDDAGAKAVLHERASIKEVLMRSDARARANFKLAAKLAEKIGAKQNEMMSMVKVPSSGNSSSITSRSPAPYSSSSSSGRSGRDSDGGYNSSVSFRDSRSSGGGGSSSGYSTSSSNNNSSSSNNSGSRGYTSSSPSYTPSGGSAGSFYPPVPSYNSSGYAGTGSSTSSSGSSSRGAIPAWQASLEAAAERLKQQEASMENKVSAARMTATESIAAAQARLSAKANESILDARGRLRTTAENSIAEARERLRKQDAEILAICRQIVARYQRGERVSDDDLEWAFRQLETRLL